MSPSRRTWTTAAAIGAGVWATRALIGASRHYSFEGKTVLITGGSRGLGLALARVFADQGARLALCARDEAELARAQAELQARGADVFVAPCDVTRRTAVDHFVRRVCERFGQVDVLVNNAGVIEVGPLESMTLEDFEEAMQTHFYGPLYFTFAVMSQMRERRDGRIVNISSIGGLLSVPHLLPYSASKFALTGFSEGLRTELAQDDVYVTTVCPGLMRTGSPRHAFFKGHPLAEFRWFMAGDVVPGVAMNPDRAAKRIVRACQQGRAQLILTPQARLAAVTNALFPAFTANVLGVVNRLLPDGYEGSKSRVEGVDLEPPRGGSLLDRLNRLAALRYNEYASS